VGDRGLQRAAVAELDRLTAWKSHHSTARSLADVATRFDELGVCWGRYQTFTQLVDEDPRCSTANELFREVDQPGIGSYLAPGSPVAFDGLLPAETAPAPLLGEHTDEGVAA
jgi:2-methylfumaryl-CoA isomerase